TAATRPSTRSLFPRSAVHESWRKHPPAEPPRRRIASTEERTCRGSRLQHSWSRSERWDADEHRRAASSRSALSHVTAATFLSLQTCQALHSNQRRSLLLDTAFVQPSPGLSLLHRTHAGTTLISSARRAILDRSNDREHPDAPARCSPTGSVHSTRLRSAGHRSSRFAE